MRVIHFLPYLLYFSRVSVWFFPWPEFMIVFPIIFLDFVSKSLCTGM